VIDIIGAPFGTFGSLDVASGVRLGEERAGDGLEEGDVVGFVVGFEGRGGEAGFAGGEEEDHEGHFGRLGGVGGV